MTGDRNPQLASPFVLTACSRYAPFLNEMSWMEDGASVRPSRLEISPRVSRLALGSQSCRRLCSETWPLGPLWAALGFGVLRVKIQEFQNSSMQCCCSCRPKLKVKSIRERSVAPELFS